MRLVRCLLDRCDDLNMGKRYFETRVLPHGADPHRHRCRHQRCERENVSSRTQSLSYPVAFRRTRRGLQARAGGASNQTYSVDRRRKIPCLSVGDAVRFHGGARDLLPNSIADPASSR
nr:hypothetical protein CFP56_56475 [Quercus suber]